MAEGGLGEQRDGGLEAGEGVDLVDRLDPVDGLRGHRHGADRLLVALVAVGLNTDVSRLREVGPRPLYVGFLAAAALSVLAFGLSVLVAGGA